MRQETGENSQNSSRWLDGMGWEASEWARQVSMTRESQAGTDPRRDGWVATGWETPNVLARDSG